jgi:hypothetical protein
MPSRIPLGITWTVFGDLSGAGWCKRSDPMAMVIVSDRYLDGLACTFCMEWGCWYTTERRFVILYFRATC